MSRSKPSYANASLWGALWKIDVEAGDSAGFDETLVQQVLERHFGAAAVEYGDALNLLRNGAVLEYGTRDEQSAQQLIDEFRSLNLICSKVQQSSEPHVRFPPFLAPAEAYISPPLLVRVYGGDGSDCQETAARLISKLCLVPAAAVQAALAECSREQPVEFPLSYQEHATSLSHRLMELGYNVDIGRATRGLFDF